jgi:ligand-binding sensor protein/GAF domain-containing protein
MAVGAPATTRQPARALVDLLGRETLQSIQDAFARAFGLPTVIVDHEARNVTEITHRVAFCEDLTRPSSLGGRCLECDLAAMLRAERDGRPAPFHCWNGLHDAAIPIVSSSGELFGHFLCGQVAAEPLDDEVYRERARLASVDPEAYAAAAREVRVVPRAAFERSVDAMGTLARMIADQASAAAQRVRMLDEALRARTATEQLADELDAIVEACAAIASTGDAYATLERMADGIARVVPHDSCMIFELDTESDVLEPRVIRDPYADAIWPVRLRPGQGIPGRVAASGVALRLDDVATSPDFAPLPGVPVEPEATLAVPLLLDGDVVGVVTLSRFHGQTFSDHELDLLRILAAQCAAALVTARFRADAARHVRAERAYAAVSRRAVAGASLDAILEQVVRSLADLAECRVALVLDDELPVRSAGLAPRELARARRRHAAVTEAARATLRLQASADDEQAVLVVPVEVASRAVGVLYLLRSPGFGEAQRQLAERFAQQLAVSIESARAERSERLLSAGYRVLTELGAEIAAVATPAEVLALLAARSHELVGGRQSVVAAVDELSGDLELRDRAPDGGARRRRLRTGGRPELRLPPADAAPEARDAWAAVLLVAAGVEAPHATGLVLSPPGGPPAAVAVAGDRAYGADQRALLAILASTATSALAATRARGTTDAALERRARELAALSAAATAVVGSRDDDGLAAAILDGFLRLAGSEAGLLCLHDECGRPLEAASRGLTASQRRRLLAGGRHAAGVVELVLEGCDGRVGALLAPPPAATADAEVLAAFARVAADAVLGLQALAAERAANARLQALRRREADQSTAHERMLATYRALSEDVLATDALARLCATLAGVLDAGVLVLDPSAAPLASAPAGAAEAWLDAAPEAGALLGPRATERAHGAGGVLYACPVQAESDRLGWLVVRLERPLDETDRSLAAYAALAAAVAMLRERTALEVEARMRGELLDAVLASDARASDLAERGRLLGLDLAAPSRVALVAVAPGGAPGSLQRVAVLRQLGDDLLVGRRGDELVVVGPAEGDWPARLEQRLSALVGPVLVGVGRPVADPALLRESHHGARKALRGLRARGRDGVLDLDGARLESVLLDAAEPERVAAFAERVIAPLRDYDARRASELVRTLHLVFEHRFNLQAAARAAHVHVSTLRYRLGRIEELTGLDLARQDDRLAAQLALLADGLLGGSA